MVEALHLCLSSGEGIRISSPSTCGMVVTAADLVYLYG
jgi:hypothetical protein